jgi:hypothetical protein
MSDQIRLEHGRLPWVPTDDSQLTRVFDEYDLPLTGVIQQDGCFYFFDCVAGRMSSRLGIWFYSHISSAELAELDDSEGSQFEELVHRIRLVGSDTFVVSLGNVGIVADVYVEDVDKDLGESLDRLTTAVEHYFENIQRSRDEFSNLNSSHTWNEMAAT